MLSLWLRMLLLQSYKYIHKSHLYNIIVNVKSGILYKKTPQNRNFFYLKFSYCKKQSVSNFNLLLSSVKHCHALFSTNHYNFESNVKLLKSISFSKISAILSYPNTFGCNPSRLNSNCNDSPSLSTK